MNEPIKDITAKGDEKRPGDLTESSTMPAEQKAATGHSAHQSEEEKRVLLLLAIIYRLLDKISSLSISYKIAGILVIILLLTVISLGFVTFSRQKNMLEQELRSRAQVLVQQLANVGKEGLLTGQELPVFTTIADIQQNSGVVYAMVIDSKKNIFVHNVLNKKGMQMEDAVSLRSLQAGSLFFRIRNTMGNLFLMPHCLSSLRQKSQDRHRKGRHICEGIERGRSPAKANVHPDFPGFHSNRGVHLVSVGKIPHQAHYYACRGNEECQPWGREHAAQCSLQG